MRRTAILLMALGLGCARNAPPSAPLNNGGGGTHEWVLEWSDDFEGPSGARPDSTRWRFDLGDGCSSGNCGWGNSEKEWYTNDPQNVALNGAGQLAIVARVAPSGLTCYYGACRYTSGKITTSGLSTVAPGRVEARIRLAAGQGLWPAFWLLGDNIGTVGWPQCGEIDIMENKGSHPDQTSSAVHGPNYSGGQSFNGAAAARHGTFVDDFHIFAVEWDTKAITFSVDSVVTFGVSRSAVEGKGAWVFDQPFFVILNQAVGGHFDGDPLSDAIFPATMLVDWVRVYRKS